MPGLTSRLLLVLLCAAMALATGPASARADWTADEGWFGRVSVSPTGDVARTTSAGCNHGHPLFPAGTLELEVRDVAGGVRFATHVPASGRYLDVCQRPPFWDADGNLYVGARAGDEASTWTLVSFDRDGHERWSTTTGYGVFFWAAGLDGASMTQGADGTLYVIVGGCGYPSKTAHLLGLNPQTGAVVLDRNTNGSPYNCSGSLDFLGTDGDRILMPGNGRTYRYTGDGTQLPYLPAPTLPITPDANERPAMGPGVNGTRVDAWRSLSMTACSYATGATVTTQWTVARMDPDGLAWTRTSGQKTAPCAQLHTDFAIVRGVPDGGAVVDGSFETGEIGIDLTGLDAHGAVRWTRDLRDGLDPTGGSILELRTSTGGQVVVFRNSLRTCPDPRRGNCRHATVSVLDAATGQIVGTPFEFNADQSSVNPAENARSFEGSTIGPGRVYLRLTDPLDSALRLRAIDVPEIRGEDLARAASSARGTTQAPLAPRHSWVALGDSYASGEGVAPFDAGTDIAAGEGPENRCHRSGGAFSVTAASELLGRDISLLDGSGWTVEQPADLVACSGAVIADLFDPNPKQIGEGAQINAVTKATNVVTLSIGGNDVGFATVLQDCLIAGALQRGLTDWPAARFAAGIACKATWAAEVSRRIEALRGRLGNVVWEIRRRAAPAARIVVVGYPELFPESLPFSVTNVLAGCWGLGASDVKWMHDEVAHLDGVILSEASSVGAEYLDTRTAFAGHDACQSEHDAWIHGIYPPTLHPASPSYWNDHERQQSFHPNSSGHDQESAQLERLLLAPPDLTRVVVTPTAGQDVTVAVGDSPAHRINATQPTSSSITAHFAATWTGGELAMTVQSPSGHVYGDTDPTAGVTTENDASSARVTVIQAEPGTWTVHLRASGTVESGATALLTTSSAAVVNLHPLAAFTVTPTSRPGDAVAFDAAASSDPDGDPLTYAWDFGDGTTGTGPAPRHSYTSAGAFRPALVVADDQLAEDRYSGPVVTVTGSPPEPPPTSETPPITAPAPTSTVTATPRRSEPARVVRRVVCTVPRLRGLTKTAARKRLKHAHCPAPHTRGPASRSVVHSQSPAARKRLFTGDRIVITLRRRHVATHRTA